VRVLANAGSLDEAGQAVLVGAEGIGLLRSEFLFRGRETPPSEDEQLSQYTALARVLGPTRPLAIRMLDIGGDKSVPFTPIAREANPLLGDRGVRVMLSRPSMLLSQIAAILRAGAAGNVRGLVPMVSTLEEWRAVRALFEMEGERLGVPPVPLGVMIEVPSAALLADQFSEEADFLAIGTNDLAQYALAMDRAHPKLAPQVDALHPAVLQLIRHTIGAAHRHGKEASICGAIAGDERAIALLVGLGVDALSVPVSAIPAVKARIRRLRRTDCEALAQDALRAGTAAEVHQLTRAGDADEEET
jgi:phosphocarrier protein FPr